MSKPTPTPPPLRREKSAAERLGIANRTLRNWRVKGIGPRHLAVGRIVFYDDSDLDRWVSERKAATTIGAGV